MKEFFALVSTQGESERSWTVDIAARRRDATAAADKLRATAQKSKADLDQAEDELAVLKTKKVPAGKLDATKTRIRELEKEIRDIQSKAQAIEDAAFDLKAVNPNSKSAEDTRSPSELINFVGEKNREIQEILRRLESLL